MAISLQARAWTAEEQLSLVSGYDSNVYRNFEGIPGEPVLGDGFLQLGADLDAYGTPWSHQQSELVAQLGARLFAVQSPEDTGVGQLTLTHSIGFNRWLALRLDGSGKDKWVANDDRAYKDLGAGATAVLGPLARTRLELRVGYRSFDYLPDPDFSEWGPALGAALISTPWRKQTLFADYRLFPQRYQGARIVPDGSTDGQRFDWYHVASVGYSLHRPFVLSATYSFIDDRSDSYGESFLRHRLELLVGVALPWELYLVGIGALQLTSYPDGLYLSPQILLLEDDDDLDEISVKLSRDLGHGLSLEARYGYYQNDLLQNGLAYRRHVVYLGLAYRH